LRKTGPHPSAANILALYEVTPAAWDKARGDRLALERGWIARFLALVPRGGHVLNLGCGSGRPSAQHLLNKGHRVTGVDGAPSLISLCRRRFPSGQWVAANMRTLSLGRAFEGVVAWHSLFHLPPDDQRAMFPIFAAHAGLGAPLLFTSGHEHGERLGEWQGEPLYSASLAPDEYRRLLADNGYDIVAHVADDPD